jgi:hypothetical protein
VTPNTESALAARENERSARELPRCKKSRTEHALDIRAKLRSAKEDPTWTQSRTDILDPNRITPMTLVELATRAKLRSDSELPR